jgi:hypothetical protein
MKLTEEEKQIILEKRKKENELKYPKTGILKHEKLIAYERDVDRAFGNYCTTSRIIKK